MVWTGTHLAFIVEGFFINGESVGAILKNFRNHFQLSRSTLFLIEKLYCSGAKTLELQAPHSNSWNIKIVKEFVL